MGYYETARMQTKEKILQSFWHLYQTKKIEKISIRNITDACGIYRTTFYLYFPDIYAVLEEIESMLLQELDGVWKKSETDRETAYEELLYAMFQKNYEYLQVFLDETKQPDFSAKYKHKLFGQICRRWNLNLCHMDRKSRFIIEKTFSGFLEIFLSLADSSLVSMKETCRVLEGYLHGGVLETIRSFVGAPQKE